MARPIQSDQDFNNVSRIVNLPAAVATGQPVVFEQLNAALESIKWKSNARVISTGNVNLAAPGGTIASVSMVVNDRVVLNNQTTASENGIYVWNGAAVPLTRALDGNTMAELTQAVITIEEGSSAGSSFRQTTVSGTLGSAAISWVAFGTSAPTASETVSGIAEIATQAEVNAGSDDLRFITPLKLASWSGRRYKIEQVIGDGTTLAFNIDHNLGTRSVTVEIFKNNGNYDTVIADVTRPTPNRVTVTFGAGNAPAASGMVVVVVG